MKRLKVLVVGAFPRPGSPIFGGVVTTCRALLDSSFPDRFDLSLVDSTQVANPAPGLLTRSFLSLRRLLRFLCTLLRFRPDAVLLFASVGLSLLEKGVMARLASLIDARTLIFPRSGLILDQAASSSLHRRWIRWALSGADLFLCQGEAWQRFAVGTVGFPVDRAPLIPNWTASNALLAVGRSRLPGVSASPLRLLFLGWLEDHKGVFELLEACRVLAGGHAFELTVAGRGNAEDDARSFVEREGLAERVAFAGWVRGAELEALLAGSDVLVLPSWSEGFPNAMIEAMAAGLAVVVSAVGNVPDVVTDGREALLVPPKDPVALAGALERVIDDADLRRGLAMRGHAFAAERYAVEPGVERLSQAIGTVVEARRD